jgi:hypothetical protein
MSNADKPHKLFASINAYLARGSHTGQPHPAAESATRLDMRFPSQRELSLPAELPRVEHALASESFRGFGINE